MESKNETALSQADVTLTKNHLKRRSWINFFVIMLNFVGYTLTFMVPKFYGATDAYVGVFVFFLCVVLVLNNVNIINALKQKDISLILLAILIVLCGINLLIVDSGKGAFFVAVNFMIIWYLADKVMLTKRQIFIISCAYMGLLIYWLLIAYPKLFADYEHYAYNTNTAATFTVFTILCAFVLLKQLYEKYEIVGLFMVILLLKGIQLVLWHRARGAFIMLCAFIFFQFMFPKRCWESKKIFVSLMILATLGSLLFVFCYVLLGTTGVNFQIPFFYKPVFSGRNRIWYEFFTLFIKKPITGIGTNVELESFWEFNVHNAMYNLLVVYGIPVFAGTLYFIYQRLYAFSKKIKGNAMAVCIMAAIFAVLFESYFDVDLIWADYSGNLIFLLAVLSESVRDKGSINGQV